MGGIRQAVKCTGRKTSGEPCRAWAVNGATVCSVHGGRAPQVKAKAARNVAERRATRALEALEDFEAISNPVERLQMLAGRAERFMEIMGARVAQLTEVRYRTDTEQLRAEVAVYERAMAAAGRLLVDLAKLDLDERSIRLQEAQVALLAGALAEALAEAGLPTDQRQAITVRVAEIVAAAEDTEVLSARRR
jgi:hypothetical protein